MRHIQRFVFNWNHRCYELRKKSIFIFSEATYIKHTFNKRTRFNLNNNNNNNNNNIWLIYLIINSSLISGYLYDNV